MFTHLCEAFIGVCHIFISYNISSIFVQFPAPASLPRLVELSWCFILRMRASTSLIIPLARESSGKVTGSMLETLNPHCQSVLPGLSKHKRLV